DGVKPVPAVADDRRSAGRCLKQSDARRKARFNHVRPGEIEGKALAAIERGMGRGLDVLDALGVVRPDDVVRILRAGNDEAEVRSAPCRVKKEPFELRLSVHTVGSEISEIPADALPRIAILIGIDGAVERYGLVGSVATLERRQTSPTRKGKVEIKKGDLPPCQISLFAAVEVRQRDRCIDIIVG